MTSSKSKFPRAVIHKKILNAAESQPDASMEAIADSVTGATTELVDNVFAEYGDPGQGNDDHDTLSTTEDMDSKGDRVEDADGVALEFNQDTAGMVSQESSSENTTNQPTDDGGDVPEEENEEQDILKCDSLTETQRETLRAIHNNPEATQAELAKRFDITAASISQRVNSIAGFEWPKRQSFTEAMFGPNTTSTKTRVKPDGGAETAVDSVEPVPETTADELSAASDVNKPVDNEERSSSGDDNACQNELNDQLATLSAQVDRLEQQLENDSPTVGIVLDPTLAHKVAHACLRSDHISEDEELQILRAMVGTDQ